MVRLHCNHMKQKDENSKKKKTTQFSGPLIVRGMMLVLVLMLMLISLCLWLRSRCGDHARG